MEIAAQPKQSHVLTGIYLSRFGLQLPAPDSVSLLCYSGCAIVESMSALRVLNRCQSSLPGSSRLPQVTTALNQARQFRSNQEPSFKSLQDEMDVGDFPTFEGDDATSVGHEILRQQREWLGYFRKIETELPQLHGQYPGITFLS